MAAGGCGGGAAIDNDGNAILPPRVFKSASRHMLHGLLFEVVGGYVFVLAVQAAVHESQPLHTQALFAVCPAVIMAAPD